MCPPCRKHNRFRVIYSRPASIVSARRPRTFGQTTEWKTLQPRHALNILSRHLSSAHLETISGSSLFSDYSPKSAQMWNDGQLTEMGDQGLMRGSHTNEEWVIKGRQRQSQQRGWVPAYMQQRRGVAPILRPSARLIFPPLKHKN